MIYFVSALHRVLNSLKRTRFSMIWVLPHPLTPSPVGKSSLFLSLPVCRRSSLLNEGGGGQTYDGEKAWSSIIHSIPSVAQHMHSYMLSSHMTFISLCSACAENFYVVAQSLFKICKRLLSLRIINVGKLGYLLNRTH
jgi:hypothetical protein